MEVVIWLFFGLFALNVALAWALIWSRRETILRHFAVPYVVLAIPIFGFVATETLGLHKPYQVAWRELSTGAKVIAYKAIPGEKIYVYLDIGEDEPRAISLPWSTETARKLAEAMEGDGNGAILRGTEDRWNPGVRVESGEPQKPLPPKPKQENGVFLPPT